MTNERINQIRSDVKKRSPLIHCITNPISINLCANAVLAVGARPIMAEHPLEVEEITETASALVLNMGNITDVRMESMLISAQTACRNNIPFVIDIVGTACSELRKNFAIDLLQKFPPTLIKGNYSEINAIYNTEYRSSGVDADKTLTVENISSSAAELAKKYNSVVLASGKVDVITDGTYVCHMKNGTAQLANITGTGCTLGALCGCYLSQSDAYSAAITACAVMGICGELSETTQGNGTFSVNLLDNLSTLTDDALLELIKKEEYKIEKN